MQQPGSIREIRQRYYQIAYVFPNADALINGHLD